MAIVQRRVFYGKVGAADELVSWATKMYGIIKAHNPAISYRVMSDHQSGRTDRVVAEIDVDSLADLDSMLSSIMEDGNARAEFEEHFGKLGDLIEYAEVEQWTIHGS
jgi:hypothetical protein